MSEAPTSSPAAQLGEWDPFALHRRVLHVAQPGEGGVAGFVDAVSAFQAEHGWDVHVAGPHPDGSSPTNRHEWDAVRNPVAGIAGESQRLDAIVAEVDPDVVVLHSAKAGLVGRMLLRGRLPTIYVPHAWSFLALPRPLVQNAVIWEKAASRWTSLVIAVSEGEALQGVRSGITAPIVVVANPAPTQWQHEQQVTPRHAREQLGLSERPTVVSVGRLSRQKGQDLLLAAWPQVLRTVAAAQLVLVGDGPERHDLQATADEAVVFAGAQQHVRPWLQAADVVALPSRWEGMALSMLEALASARCVVTHHVAGSDVVIRARAGAVVAVGDQQRFAHAVALRLQRPELAKVEGDRGARYVAAHHAAEGCYRSFSAACARAHAFGSPAARRDSHAPS